MAWQDFAYFPAYDIPACLDPLERAGQIALVDSVYPGHDGGLSDHGQGEPKADPAARRVDARADHRHLESLAGAAGAGHAPALDVRGGDVPLRSRGEGAGRETLSLAARRSTAMRSRRSGTT